MKKKRFTEEQIIGVLREHEAGAKAADLARKYAVSEMTLYNWKAKFVGMDVSEAKRPKALQEENTRLKKLLADQMLDAAALRELLEKGGRARRQARESRAASGHPWACRNVGPAKSSPSTARRSAIRLGDQRTRNRGPSCVNSRTAHRRFGYRRLFAFPRQEGETSGRNRTYRLYREEGLAVRKRRARRRAVGTRAPIPAEAKPNARWSLASCAISSAAGGVWHPQRRRRRDARMPGGDPGHIDLWQAHRARADGPDRAARQGQA